MSCTLGEDSGGREGQLAKSPAGPQKLGDRLGDRTDWRTETNNYVTDLYNHNMN